MRNLIRSIWTQLWLTGVVCLVLLALYTSLGRQLIPLIETKTADAENELSAQLGTDVTIGSLQGGWVWFSPKVTVRDIIIGEGEHRLKIARLDAELDVSASFFYLVPVFDSLTLSGVELPLIQDESLAWRFGDFSLSSGQGNTAPNISFGQGDKPLWLKLLGQQGEIHLSDWRIDIQQFNKPIKAIQLLDIRLRNNGLQHWLDGEIQLVKSGAILKTQLEVEGDLWDLSQHNGKGFLELETHSWKDWLPDYQSQWQVNEISLGAKLWVDVENGLLNNLDGYIDIPDFSLTKDDGSQTQSLAFQEGRITLAGRRDDQDWHLWFDSHLEWMSGFTLPKPKGRVSWLPSAAGGFQLALDDADLKMTANWLEGFNVFEPIYMDYITNLKPHGRAENIRINIIPELDWQWEANFDVKEASIQSWEGIPAAEKLNGHVRLNAEKGVLKILNSDTYLHFPNLYKKGWLLEKATADIFWKIYPDYLKLSSPNIDAGYHSTQLKGAFSFYKPFEGSLVEPQLNLMLGLKDLNLTLQTKLVPYTVPEEISGWLNHNIKSGHADQASFIFAGAIAPDSLPISKTIQVYGEVNNTHISYRQQWPEVTDISADFIVDIPNVDIWLDEAKTLGGDLIPSSGKISIQTDDHQTWLSVNAKIKGPAAEGMKYLTDTPISKKVGTAFESWVATGDMTSELSVKLPLDSRDNTGPNQGVDDKGKVRLIANLHNAALSLTDVDLAFSNINGEITYDSDDGLKSKTIQAKTFSGDITAEVSSAKQSDGFDITVAAQGRAHISAIKKRLPLFILKPLSGELDYQSNLLIRPDSRGGIEFNLSSDLHGVDLAAPVPFSKTSEQAIPFNLGINKNRDLRINFRYGDLANGVLALEAGELTRGQVYLGTAQAYLPSDNGLSISGNLDYELDAKAWWDLWNDIRPDPNLNSTESNAIEQKSALLTHINISALSVNAWQQPMGDTQIEGHHKWGRWLFDVNSQMTKGKIILPDDLVNNAIEMDLEYIHMPVSDGPNNNTRFGSSETVDSLADFDPQWIPQIDMKVGEVFLGTSNFGRWDLSIRQREDFTRIKINDSYSKSMTIKGDIDWSKDTSGHKTHLNLLRLSSAKIGDSQRNFRKAAAIEAKDSNFDLDLTWRGSPAGFNYASLNGLAKIRLKDGVLVSDNAGALKAFGVLNFNSISRRLQLDFSDLYEKGIVFDVLKTRLSFDKGIATFVDPLWIDGPSAKFQSSGFVNFNTDEISQKMVVTFPVTSSLPLVAVLAGLAPQIAGAIYVTEKLIGEELEQFTSASYSISGTIENPKMKINQAFDNKLEGKESRSLKNRFLDIFGLGSD